MPINTFYEAINIVYSYEVPVNIRKAYQALRLWLVARRHEKQLTQWQLADLLDVPYFWVGKVEPGERRLDVVEYVRLCGVLEIDPRTGLTLLSGR
jgi:hypothetical protein